MATGKAETRLVSTIDAFSGIDNAKSKDSAALLTNWVMLVKKEELTGGIADELEERHNEVGTAQETPRDQTLDAARAELRSKDPVIRRLIDANPNLDHHAWRATLPVQGLFEALLFQIVGQQISIAAGNAIFARLRALYSADHDPATLAKRSVDELRATGLSTRKAEYVNDLTRRAEAGELTGLEYLPHEEARTRLTSFRGIGPWTADGALFIAFGGDDVLVSGDLVLRKAVQRAYNLPAMPSEKDVEAIGEQWRPYRSVAAVYLFECMESV